MNKKLLFAVMSLAALTACTNDDFDSQDAAEKVSPIQFEVINDAATRASMNGNTISWNVNDNDLFTLYHGAEVGAVTGYQNATYKATANQGANATLTSPSMILPGGAIMVWPVDSVFNIGSDDNLSITIPAEQSNIENFIPYVSDQIEIAEYAKYNTATGTDYNTAGYSRKYPVYMRPMASQLNLKADYAGTDATIASLYEGKPGVNAGEGIEPIKVNSISLLTEDAEEDGTLFTTEIALAFSDGANANWPAAATNHHAWKRMTQFGDVIEDSPVLTTTCLNGNDGCKFLMLPQAEIEEGVKKAAVLVDTYYGKVLIAKHDDYEESKYSNDEYNKAWYRYLTDRLEDATDEENASATTTTEIDGKQKYKTVAKSLALGMQQTINTFSSYTAPSGTVKGEQMGIASTRYVVVNLEHLDMSDLHIKNDKQLRDVARVWGKLSLDDVTVYLDGDADEEFEMTQTTIGVINAVNGARNDHKKFTVKPCKDENEGNECSSIVITGGNNIQNIDFIVSNDDFDETQAEVILAAATTWKWAGSVKVGTGVSQIRNCGTLENTTGATLKLLVGENNDAIALVNDGRWDITAGTVFVQFDVTNNGTVNISNGAEYRESGNNHVFTNQATTLEGRFLDSENQAHVGKVNNSGVFATTDNGTINNYGLIEHEHVNAKTYITSNEIGTGENGAANFGVAFSKTTPNKMGRINLPWENKNEDNISISAALAQGFVSVTVDRETASALDASSVGNKVNYVIVKHGVTEIHAVSEQVKYLEINQPNTEIAWEVEDPTTYTGLVVLSNVNIKLGTTIHVTGSTYLGATMYVGGTFDNEGSGNEPGLPSWSGYFGDTNDNFTTKYVTY